VVFSVVLWWFSTFDGTFFAASGFFLEVIQEGSHYRGWS
jgi:hypothetical protein